MKLVTIDLNTGHVIKELPVDAAIIGRARSVFSAYILPSLKEMKRTGKRKVFRVVGRNTYTMWTRDAVYVGGRKETVIGLRVSWDTDRAALCDVLRVGFTLLEKQSGKMRCPFVLDMGGVITIQLTECAYNWLMDCEDVEDIGFI